MNRKTDNLPIKVVIGIVNSIFSFNYVFEANQAAPFLVELWL